MKYASRKLRKLLVLSLGSCLGVGIAALPAFASSSAIATGDSTVDGRPVAWKNRDHWSTADGWKVIPFYYQADASSFGSGDRYTSRFNYMAASALGSSGLDEITGIQVPWAGANDRGLGLVQVAGHTLTSSFAQDHGYAVSQDLANGMKGGYLNHVVLSRAEHVDEVEQILRDTNNGGGFNNSTARNTSTIISVFDRWGNAAVFEIDGDSFTRDNTTQEFFQDANGYYSDVHDDDKDATNPADGTFAGYDWRTNFSKVQWTKPSGFPYFVDSQITEVDGNGDIVNSGSTSDGIHDWEYSSSAVKRHTRAAIRMDDDHKKDYRYFIQKYVGSGALGDDYTIESLSKNVGYLPGASPDKSTGWHLNRFVSTFGTVFVGSKASDPYDGKLTTMWVALGEPTVSVFVPLFPYSGTVPTELSDMYVETNVKRKQVYSYTSDDSCGYSCGRNVDHTIDINALSGGGYYGEGGIHRYTFAIENWAFDQYDEFMEDLRSNSRTEAQLKTDMIAWQQSIATNVRSFYAAEQSPLHIIDNKQATGSNGWGTSTTQPNYYDTNYDYRGTNGKIRNRIWRPDIEIAGDYNVYYWLPDGTSNRATDAPFTVYYNGGSQTFYVNQQLPGGSWIKLGTFDFAIGTSGYVELTNNANNSYVIADAVKFEKQ